MSNSLMFQRFPTHNGYDDPQFSNFYGQTLPLVKRGIPVQTVHMENLSYPATLDKIKVLVMSYSNMKPNSPAVHKALAEWVRKGGVLIYCGRDGDPYQKVMEWWDTHGNHYTAPSQHLFKLLGIRPGSAGGPADAGSSAGFSAGSSAAGSSAGSSAANPGVSPPQRFAVGKGAVYIIRQDPKEFVLRPHGDSTYFRLLSSAYSADAKAGTLVVKNNFYLERGPYDIISVLDENTDRQPYIVKGPVIDLFDPQLPVLASKTVYPGEQSLVYDLSRVADPGRPAVLASASRIYDTLAADKSISFVARSPINTQNSMRVLLPARPASITVTDSRGQRVLDLQTSWDTSSNTLYLGFANSPDGIKVDVKW
jgi:hypothetical protein